MEKNNVPFISRIMRAMILEDYTQALDLVTSEEFDPNQRTKTWDSPIISAIITITEGMTHKKPLDDMKKVIQTIIKHENYNPNAVDAENETTLMRVARSKEFCWVAPMLLEKKFIDVNIKNYLGRTALDIAVMCNNSVVRDVLMVYKVKDCTLKQPKKITGLKKRNKATVVTVNNTNVLDKIENAFENDRKDDPFSLYNLVKNFLKGNYEECMRIATNVHFDPNEFDRWGEPALSSLVYYSQDANVTYDEAKFKEIASAIINNRQFDVNSLDADTNTPLMVAMGFPKLDWLVKSLFRISSARIDIKNELGEDLKEIANKCGNGALYDEMIRRSYETANVVS